MNRSHYLKSVLAGGASALALATGAFAEDFNVPSGDLKTALNVYANQARVALIVSGDTIGNARTKGATGNLSAEVALARILEGTGLTTRRTATGAIGVVRKDELDTKTGNQIAQLAQASPAKPFAAAGIESVLVTAQKKTEDIQFVPIAVTALNQEQLQAMKIEGGPDLLKVIPNVTFSKNNFTSYNFSIRGIGTKAISVTTDPGVAVEFNSTAFIRNRLFEQEYFDVERVEVLRGPQGTLHGRNATAGVINVISAKPDMGEFSGSLKGEVGNYKTKRLSGMINIPLIEDKLAIRFAGALTNRSGYDYNSVTKHQINGRDLWSGRVTVGFQPTERLHADLVWERFNEDDDRSRTGKQLCHRDDGAVTEISGSLLSPAERGPYSQGCKMGSLYDDDAFGTPNGYSIPFISAATAASGIVPGGATVIDSVDPYGGLMQSRDLRTVASVIDPKYQANADLVELNLSYDLTDHLTLTSQTGYDKDRVYSIQDYNRFNSFPVFRNTSDPTSIADNQPPWTCFRPLFDIEDGTLTQNGCVDFTNFAPGGVFTDPQIGPSNTIAGVDISTARSKQFSQELRLESSFAGPVNFSMGANYLRYRTLEDYYVMFNLITALNESVLNGSADIYHCPQPVGAFIPLYFYGVDTPIDSKGCTYIDPNPIESINGDGHNYFRSKNPYLLRSASAFGEMYWQARDDLKFTLGLRYTDDHKTFTPVPSQVLLSSNPIAGGTVDRGYPALPDIKQHWGEMTGRVGVDWKPDLDFTDQTMIYSFYSRGYKGGGANPPGIGFRTQPVTYCEASQIPLFCDSPFGSFPIPPLLLTLAYPLTFEPEFVNAYEVGTKNTLMDGALVFNNDVFFYDYKNYQVSQIKDRTAVNENFNAKVWGAEVEATFQPSHNFRVNGTFGFQDSRIADGEKSIDLMNRTQGNPDWIVVKPWIQLASNCIVPRSAIGIAFTRLCRGYGIAESPQGLIDYVDSFPTHNGQGFDADLSGNKLPNAPHWTISLGAQYSYDFLESWRATLRGDAYWQSQSWARVYNDDPYDKLHGWYNANISVTIQRPDDGLSIELYAKNVLDGTAITDAFLNSDDTALTTNVFTLDPRLIGFSITKTF